MQDPELMDAETLIGVLGVDHKRFGALLKIHCYNANFHNNGDNNPSLTVYGGTRGYYCYACGENGSNSWLMKQFGIEDPKYAKKNKTYSSGVSRPANTQPKEPTKKNYKVYPLDDIYKTLAGLPPEATEVLEAKGFPWQRWENDAGWRWHENQIEGWGRGIFIPYIVDGTIATARLRMLEGNPRFKSLPEAESFPFQADNLKNNERVYVCEGETDCMTLNFLGYPAVAVPGSTLVEPIRKICEMAAANGTKLIVVPDQDKAGQEFLARVRLQAFDHGVAIDEFQIPVFKDMNEWFCAEGEENVDFALMRHANSDPFAPLEWVPETVIEDNKQGELGV